MLVSNRAGYRSQTGTKIEAVVYLLPFIAGQDIPYISMAIEDVPLVEAFPLGQTAILYAIVFRKAKLV